MPPRRLTHLPAGLGWSDDPPPASTRAIAAAATTAPMDPYVGDLQAHFMAPFEPVQSRPADLVAHRMRPFERAMPAPIRPAPPPVGRARASGDGFPSDKPSCGCSGGCGTTGGTNESRGPITGPGGMDTLRDVTPGAAPGYSCNCQAAPSPMEARSLRHPLGLAAPRRELPSDFRPLGDAAPPRCGPRLPASCDGCPGRCVPIQFADSRRLPTGEVVTPVIYGCVDNGRSGLNQLLDLCACARAETAAVGADQCRIQGLIWEAEVLSGEVSEQGILNALEESFPRHTVRCTFDPLAAAREQEARGCALGRMWVVER